MPRVGGIYSLPSGNPIGNGSVANSTTMNSTLDDLGDEITNSVPRDGSAAASADLPMGTFKLTNVGNASSRNQYAAAGQIQDAGLVTLGSVSGTNTITAALTPAILAYSAGMRVSFEPANDNTGAVTIAINGLSAVAIVKVTGAPLTGGELVAGVPALLIYDGTQFYLTNPCAQILGKYKPATTARTSTTTVADDPDLILPLSPGAWEYKLYVEWQSVASTTPALKYAVNYSGTRTGHPLLVMSNESGTFAATAGDANSEIGVAALPIAHTTIYILQVEGTLIVTTTGNLRFQWSQVTSSVSATQVIAGSRFTAKRFA